MNALNRYYSALADGTDAPLLPDPSLSSHYTDIIYGKGSYVLHTLRYNMGDAQFLNELRAYASGVIGSITSGEAFKNSLESSSGTDLDWFFSDWIYRSGSPLFAYADYYSGN